MNVEILGRKSKVHHVGEGEKTLCGASATGRSQLTMLPATCKRCEASMQKLTKRKAVDTLPTDEQPESHREATSQSAD